MSFPLFTGMILRAGYPYTVPKEMKVDEEFTLELILHPFESQDSLSTHVATLSGLSTSTGEPGTLVAPGNHPVVIVQKPVKITSRMKVTLTSADLDIFTVQQLHPNEIQLISPTEATRWHWLLTAKKEGTGKLIMVVSQLVQYDDEDSWHEVDSRVETIIVKVTLGQRIKRRFEKVDLLGVIGYLITAIIGGILIPLWYKRINEKRKAKTIKKYAPLEEYLRKSKGISELTLTFDEIKDMIGEELPDSAKKSSWWANESKGNRVQANAWLNAGWEVSNADTTNRKVTFKKKVS